MPAVSIHLDGEGCWPDLGGKTVHHNTSPAIEFAVLDGGMVSGKPSVSIRIDLNDQEVVLAETSLELFLGVARAFEARYPAPSAQIRPSSQFALWLKVFRPEVKLLHWQEDFANAFLDGDVEGLLVARAPGSGKTFLSDLLREFNEFMEGARYG
jgi:hypothetical protein